MWTPNLGTYYSNVVWAGREPSSLLSRPGSDGCDRFYSSDANPILCHVVAVRPGPLWDPQPVGVCSTQEYSTVRQPSLHDRITTQYPPSASHPSRVVLPPHDGGASRWAGTRDRASPARADVC
jgi:hypothetical protein